MADENIDKAKGRAKEAAGALTGDDELKEEGRRDQAKGAMDGAREKLGDAVDAVKDAVDDAKDAVKKRV